MSLKTSYRFIAPFYDWFIRPATGRAREASLAQLPRQGESRILLSGAGTGLEFPYLPANHRYTALDLTPAMLDQARARAGGLRVEWVRGDSMALPFADESFDWVVLHLIVAVVPRPELCLREAARVLKPGGRILVFDKFLHPGQRAPLRRCLTPLSGELATRMDVVFEEVLEKVPSLRVLSDRPALAGGWFRLIALQKEERVAV